MSGKIFELVQTEQPNRNSFDLTHDYKSTLNLGDLMPCCVIECLPGDSFNLGSQALVRFSPLVAPTMQKFDSRIEYFFVPNRLLWKNWMKFITSDPGDLPNIPAFPTVTYGSTFFSKLMDRLGLPRPIAANTEKVSALPMAAFQMIYDWYYRDQNLQPTDVNSYTLIDGDNSANLAALGANRVRCWEHDMFTSCLPFAQKGNPVTIGTTSYDDVSVYANLSLGTDTFINNTGAFTSQPSGTTGFPVSMDIDTYTGPSPLAGGLYADTSELDALSITINDLREAEALQKWLELNARGGTRPDEVIKTHFGVDPGDARIQKPEYIVGVKQPVYVSEVLNTAGLEISGSGSPQGTMAGHGIATIDDENYGSYFCREHGFIIGIMSVLPKTSYTQGLEKFWLKTTDATQYYWPSFAHIGEQPLLNKEVYAFQGANGNNTFGYLPAYQDYRYKTSITTGDFRTTLAFWTAARQFSSAPALNGQFVSADAVSKDIFAVNDPNLDSLYVHVINKVFATRPVPVYGTPSLT